MKTCTVCGETKADDKFRGYSRTCRACQSAAATQRNRDFKERDPEGFAARQAKYAKTYRAKPEKRAAMRAQRVRVKYGLDPEQLEGMLEEQGGACAICRVDFGEATPRVDHDHACCNTDYTCGMCVRGLLCNRCNRALGFMYDDPDRLKRAVLYLEKNRV